MNQRIFLLDVDGVLIQASGYRQSVRATLNSIAAQMGLGEVAPEEDTIAIFEAQGITCEWDMIPMLVAALVETQLTGRDELPEFLCALVDTCDWLSTHPAPQPKPVDWSRWIHAMGRFQQVGSAPAETLLHACQQGEARDVFPILSQVGLYLLEDLLTHTRQPSLSRTTHLFQTFVLGDDRFAHAMGIPAAVTTPSYLVRHDLPLLRPETAQILLAAEARRQLRMVAYTARPSAPMGWLPDKMAIFTPEAEMALEQVGLGSIVLVGSGQMGEAAIALDESADRLTKPSAYHALAAIAAGLVGSRKAAIEWMGRVFCFVERAEPNPGLHTLVGKLPKAFTVDIFEDSPSGMRAGLQAVTLFAQLGAEMRLHLWGVTDHPEKSAALAALGAQVSPEINLAVQQALANE